MITVMSLVVLTRCSFLCVVSCMAVSVLDNAVVSCSFCVCGGVVYLLRGWFNVI